MVHLAHDNLELAEWLQACIEYAVTKVVGRVAQDPGPIVGHEHLFGLIPINIVHVLEEGGLVEVFWNFSGNFSMIVAWGLLDRITMAHELLFLPVESHGPWRVSCSSSCWTWPGWTAPH